MASEDNSKGCVRHVAPAATRFASLIAAAEAHPLPPVERWDPPYCGDAGFEIKRDGTWFYQGSPIGRRPLVQLFSRILRREGDGRFYLVTPVEKVLVNVEDAPFLAVEMDVVGASQEQLLVFRTNVDDVVPCGPEHPLRFEIEPVGGGLKPYLRVRGHLEALVTRGVYYDLVALAIGDDEDQRPPGVWSGGAWFPLEETGVS